MLLDNFAVDILNRIKIFGLQLKPYWLCPLSAACPVCGLCRFLIFNYNSGFTSLSFTAKERGNDTHVCQVFCNVHISSCVIYWTRQRHFAEGWVAVLVALLCINYFQLQNCSVKLSFFLPCYSRLAIIMCRLMKCVKTIGSWFVCFWRDSPPPLTSGPGSPQSRGF